MYAIDLAEAKRADSTGNQIKEIGKYLGTFTQAADITAKTGTKGIAFNFVTSTGQKARFSIYTMKADGTKLGGYGTLSAMMACCLMQFRSVWQYWQPFGLGAGVCPSPVSCWLFSQRQRLVCTVFCK